MRKKKLSTHIGQSTVEYALLLAIVASAIIGMQIYLKRGIQGRIRDLADQISATQYEQGRTFSNSITNQTGSTNTTVVAGVTTTKTYENIQRSGNEVVQPE